MSTASVGKSKEREVVHLLEEHGWTAERVPRSVADATPVDDVVAVPRTLDEVDHDRPVTRRLQTGQLTRDDLLEVEVKYRSSGGYGMATLYDKHLETVGLGTHRPVVWSSGLSSGGSEALYACTARDVESIDVWSCQEALPKTTRDLLDDGVDVVAMRQAREPWLFVW